MQIPVSPQNPSPGSFSLRLYELCTHTATALPKCHAWSVCPLHCLDTLGKASHPTASRKPLQSNNPMFTALPLPSLRSSLPSSVKAIEVSLINAPGFPGVFLLVFWFFF